MTFRAGDRLLGYLHDLSVGSSDWTVVSEEYNGGSRWRLRGTAWSVDIVIEPLRGLGLEFELRDLETGRHVGYDIDTDLYDITRGEQREFVEGIERDIIEFVENLRRHTVLRGKEKSNVVIVFPLGGEYIRLVGGRFTTRSSIHSQESAARGGVSYRPVN